ncbi:MAG: glucose-6-phosphate isomerase [Coriobacteriia bacterium]
MDAAARLLASDAAARLARRDPALWAADAAGAARVRERLGWTRLATDAARLLPELAALVDHARGLDVSDVVLLGMGGSSLAPLVLSRVLGTAPGAARLTVLDTTSPRSVRDALDRLDPRRALVIVSSKSGTTIEPLSLYAILRAWADEALGRREAGGRFVAITDPGSPLVSLARDEGFAMSLPAPPDVGGRFSALTVFGLAPAALIGADLPALLSRAEAMEKACAASGGPAAELAAFIGDALASGRDKLTIACSAEFAAFGLWAEQLLAESTGKGGAGVVPILAGPRGTPAGVASDAAAVLVRSTRDTAITAWTAALPPGTPVLDLALDSPLDLAAEFVRWEYATALVGHLMGIDPFDQPDVARAKSATEAILAGTLVAPATAAGDPASALRPVLAAVRPGDYLAVLAYLPDDDHLLAPLRDSLSAAGASLGVATCLEVGPRYLHSTGQLHKGGPDEGVFIVLTTRDATDVPVPGRGWGLRALFGAQADGDLATLASLGRRVARFDLQDADAENVAGFSRALTEAARTIRPSRS